MRRLFKSTVSKQTKALITRLSRVKHIRIYSIIAAALLGVTFLTASRASTFSVSIKPQSTSGCVQNISDSSASGGSAIQFCTAGNNNPPTVFNPGAKLPIDYDINTLSGTKRYVSPSGNDTSGTGSASTPYATINKAISVASANDTIVLRQGTYRQGNISINKTLKIIAYPKETPTINGAQVFNGSWTPEGSLSYRTYAPMSTPKNGDLGINWDDNQNLANPIGLYPDQAWIGNTMLQQVATKAAVTNGKFYVDRPSNRLYITSSDAGKSNIEVSQQQVAVTVGAPGVALEGLQFTRFSAHAGQQASLVFNGSADNSVMRNVEIFDTAFVSVKYAESGTNVNTGSLMKNVTIQGSNWMGVNANYTTDLVLDSVKLNEMNRFSEFTPSPQSGGLKTSRTWGTQVINSEVKNNKSHGIWFDQSNYKSVVAGSRITNNSNTSVFFEISDDLLMINNYITGVKENVKLAGSSGLKLINNTIVGGNNPVGIYTDSRSQPGCAASNSGCKSDTQTYSSDRDSIRSRPATMDWMPRIDYMVNNIIGYPSAVQYCSGSSPVCITLNNSNTSTSIQAVIHQANTPHAGIPKTFIDDNVYINGSGRIFTTSTTSYYDIATFRNAMAASPVSISGIEAGGRSGNTWVNSDGTPTSALNAVHGDATPIDAKYNKYISTGTKHYGVLNN